MSSLLRVIFDPDTTPPGVPTLSAPTVVGQDRLDLSWTAVTDTGGSGLAGYDIQIDGTTVVATGVQTTYSATGFTAASTHTFRVRARDGAGNSSAYSNQVSGTTAAAAAPFNPSYPRLGSYAIGGQQNYENAAVQTALSRRHVNIVTEFPGWRLSRGTTMSAVMAAVKAASTVGTKMFAYAIYSEIAKANASAGQAYWEPYQYLTTNKLFAYSNGAAETGPLDADAGPSIAKINYTTGSKTVSGKQTGPYMLDFYTGFLRDGASVSNGTTTLTAIANPNVDGLFFDNVFWRERTDADYNLNGTADGLAAGTSFIQASHAALATRYRTTWPNAPLMVNSADWAQADPFFGGPAAISTTVYNQMAEGGAIESILNYESLAFSSMMLSISTQMNAYKSPKLGILGWDIGALTNYQIMRYGLGVALLTDTYYYPYVGNYLSQDLPSLWYDEFSFSLGTATDPVQTAARYQAGTNGEGIWRRDFANGIVLVGARRSNGSTTPYSAQALGGTFYKLNGTQDAATNNGATITSITLNPRDAVVLSRTPTASSNGFTADSGFTVVALDGNFNHNSRLQISRSAGQWAARDFGTSPWVYDTGAAAWLGGVARGSISGYAANATLPEPSDPSTSCFYKMGNVTHPVKVATSATRTAPNSFTTRWWYNDGGENQMKCELAEPVWPSAYGGSQLNKKLYLSYWLRTKLQVSGSFSQGKLTRFNSADHTQSNNDALTSTFPFDGKQWSGFTHYDAVPTLQAATWTRVEVYLETSAITPRFDSKLRYRYVIGGMSGLGGNFEFRKPGDQLYVSNAQNPGWETSWQRIVAGVIGFDGQDSVFTGQELDVANVYVDCNYERFEISTASTLAEWQAGIAPFTDSDGTPAELQGRWNRDSNTQATVYINQGQFTNLSGKYLWYVDGFKTATRIGRFS